MKISGFTFIRNGTILGYPFIESINSILPICDEFIIAVGPSEDDTLTLLKKIKSKKIKIIQTQWNENMKDRGFVYAQQKMIAQFNCSGDWAFYLEGDEVVHQDDLKIIKKAMKNSLNNFKIESLVFDYIHFFGNKDWIATARPGTEKKQELFEIIFAYGLLTRFILSIWIKIKMVGIRTQFQ